MDFQPERIRSVVTIDQERLGETHPLIVIALGVVKRPDRQINYGTGGDVSAESVADARIPLRIRWT